MTRRERQQRIEWCKDQMNRFGTLWFCGMLTAAQDSQAKSIKQELAHYARQDRRRAKRRNTK